MLFVDSHLRSFESFDGIRRRIQCFEASVAVDVLRAQTRVVCHWQGPVKDQLCSLIFGRFLFYIRTVIS